MPRLKGSTLYVREDARIPAFCDDLEAQNNILIQEADFGIAKLVYSNRI